MNIKELIDNVWSARRDLENALVKLQDSADGYVSYDLIRFTEIENIATDVEELENDIDGLIEDIDNKRKRASEIYKLFADELGDDKTLIEKFKDWIDYELGHINEDEIDEFDFYNEFNIYMSDDKEYSSMLSDVLEIVSKKASNDSKVIENKINELIRAYLELKCETDDDD